jgi:hypothetical protein
MMRRAMKLRGVVAVIVLVGCVAAAAADRKYIVKPRASDIKGLPFSDGVLAGNTLYLNSSLILYTTLPTAPPKYKRNT